MTGRGGGREADAAGGPARHVPVLLAEVLRALEPVQGGTILDGTFGAGGYTAALLDADPRTSVLALDRDPEAVAAGRALVESTHRLSLVHTTFGSLDAAAREAGLARLDGIVLDIGVSSMQLDQPDRGFSFRQDGPLDMRMSQDGPSAADIVNEAEESDLADILFQYGEERRSRAIARAVVERRRREPFRTTQDLAALVARHVRAEPGLNPATRTFQALRIAVNDELGQLADGLAAAERVLRPGGRLAVVTFHSLEDRIVKLFLQGRAGAAPRASRHLPDAAGSAPSFTLVRRGPIAAGEAEIAANPRARSAKLRIAERTEAPAHPDEAGSGPARRWQDARAAR